MSLLRDNANLLNHPLQQVQKRFEKMMQEFENDSMLTTHRNSFLPTCDVEEMDDHYLLTVDLPGVKKDDIRVELHSNTLTVSGERKSESREKRKNNCRSEREYGYFERSFRLPDEVNPEKISTEYQDGVLRVEIPKQETQSHRIKIGGSKPRASIN